MNVRVGSYRPPEGGPAIRQRLQELLNRVNERKISEFDAHVCYETLHPFTDGNGRSGRAIWLWQNSGYAPLGFLHSFYYQTLEASGR